MSVIRFPVSESKKPRLGWLPVGAFWVRWQPGFSAGLPSSLFGRWRSYGRPGLWL